MADHPHLSFDPGQDPVEFWLQIAEAVRDYPTWLGFVQRTNLRLYTALVDGLRTLAISARSEEWRDPREGVGARPEQLVPGTPGSFSDRTDWLVWLLMGGRGSGKSRTGAEAIRELLYGRNWSEDPRVALVGQALESVRIDMVERTLLEVVPASSVIRWNRSTCELWLDLGMHLVGGRRVPRIAYLKGYSSEAARKLRGPNFHLAWADEIATWTDANRSPGAESTTWSNMAMAVRMDDRGTWTPRIIATTTPKSVTLIRNVDQADPLNPGPGIHDDEFTVVSQMSTMDNQANLSSDFFRTQIEPKKGTRIYDQEVLGILMDAALGALWTREQVDAMTVSEGWPLAQGGGFTRTVVGVDPSVGSGDGDECGIVVAGLARDGRAYVLEDLSMRGTPAEWIKVVTDAYHRHGCDAAVVETNNGGALFEELIRREDASVHVVEVWAKAGKVLRAEPVALLSDRDRVRFADNMTEVDGKRVAPKFVRLQHQMTTWEQDGPSPDRLDAFVYACLNLLPEADNVTRVLSVIRRRRRRPVPA